MGQASRYAVSVYKDGDGTICTVLSKRTVPSPEEAVGDTGKSIFGGCEVDGDEGPGPFDTALAHIAGPTGGSTR